MNILSDFDGVLTEQTHEALRVKELFKDALLKSASSPALLLSELEKLESDMNNSPENFGWKVNGKISAFCQEDLFIWNNGLGAALDERADAGNAILAAVRNQLVEAKSFVALAQWAYVKMVEETKAGVMKPLDPAAVEVVNRILAAGHKFVVVSNSETDRIVDLFTKGGLKFSSNFTVRGGAKKFSLGEGSESVQIGKYKCLASRPSYEEIILEEKPHMVIGDVFSLDLALPLYLSQKFAADFSGIHLVLRTRDYTPSWVKEYFLAGQHSGAKLKMISDFQQIEQWIR